MTRVKPIKIRSTELSAPSVLTVTVERYELFEGVSREGKAYEEDRIYWSSSGLDYFLVLNQTSLIWLANHGIDVSEESLTKGSLNGITITFELVKDEGPFNFYRPIKMRRAKK